MDRQGPLQRLRKMTEGRGVVIGLAVLAAIAIVLVGVLVYPAGGEGDDETVRTTDVATPTASRTPRSIGTSIPTVPSAGLLTPIVVSQGATLTTGDLAARGVGTPGRGPFTGQRLRIPAIGVDAPFTARVVGEDGQMPNPQGPEDVAWYDFSAWDGLGGLPAAGGNVVLAGHVDYINYGPAVFWRLRELEPGDRVQIQLQDGTLAEYAIEFNKTVPADFGDWPAIVAATADESVTLITCVGQFSAGRYSDRQVAWGRRVA